MTQLQRFNPPQAGQPSMPMLGYAAQDPRYGTGKAQSYYI
jgi:hypothetical protein